MFALKGKNIRPKGGVATSGGASRFVGHHPVLPRFLRKPARAAVRLFSGEIAFPRYIGTAGAAGFLALTGVYGAIVGGHTPEVVKATTSTFGFAVEDVRVTGNVETSEIDVLGALALDGSTSLIGVGAEDLRASIAALPWVVSVDVFKVYPSAINVAIRERVAVAIWQHDSELSLIDSDGRVIVPYTGARHSDLPLVVGTGAETHSKGLMAMVAVYPDLAQRVKAYRRIADRRWDLLLDNGVTVMLPEANVEAALAKIQTLDEGDNILSRAIVSVDMRLADRLVVRLTPEAALGRAEALKVIEKNAGRRV
ncbi:MAG: cell division protein FtsQ/DivIB [Phyllobacterium sp.]